MIELRKLTTNDGADVFEMIQEIGKGENGFTKPQFVPQTIYWLYVDGKPVGYGKLRHYLNQNLLQNGGNIGYAIRPTDRGKGYAKILLKKLVQESMEKQIDQVLLTCYENNKASRKVIDSNGGELKDKKDGVCFYWININ
jgi:predicted acetyltransferase